MKISIIEAYRIQTIMTRFEGIGACPSSVGVIYTVRRSDLLVLFILAP